MVEGTQKVTLPSDFMKSIGINESNFKQDSKGNYRLDPNTKPSKSSRTILEERLKNQIHKQIVREGGDVAEERISPAERKRIDQMNFEKYKYEAKLKREEKHDEMKMAQFEKQRQNQRAKREEQRQDQQAKREEQREREKMTEDRKYAEMMMRMYDKEAQRRAGEKKGDSGDKALMEKMMRMMADQRKEKAEKPVVLKEGKGAQMVPVPVPGKAQKVVVKQPGKSKSKSKDKKRLMRYKRMLRALKHSHKKALSKKTKSGRKRPMSRKMKKLIIRNTVNANPEVDTRRADTENVSVEVAVVAATNAVKKSVVIAEEADDQRSQRKIRSKKKKRKNTTNVANIRKLI